MQKVEKSDKSSTLRPGGIASKLTLEKVTKSVKTALFRENTTFELFALLSVSVSYQTGGVSRNPGISGEET